MASANAMTIYNSILADNTALVAPDFYSFSYGTSTASFSLIENPGGATINTTVAGSNLTGVDPQLNGLSDNGGPTPTQKPAVTSPVIDQGKRAVPSRPARARTAVRRPDDPELAGGQRLGHRRGRAPGLRAAVERLLGQDKGKTLLVSVSAAGSVSVSDAAAPLSAADAKKKKKRTLLLNPSSGSGGPPTISCGAGSHQAAKQKLRQKGKVTVNARITLHAQPRHPQDSDDEAEDQGQEEKEEVAPAGRGRAVRPRSYIERGWHR